MSKWSEYVMLTRLIYLILILLIFIVIIKRAFFTIKHMKMTFHNKMEDDILIDYMNFIF